MYVYTFFCIRISSPVESTAIPDLKILRNIPQNPMCCIYHVNQAPELILYFLSVSFLSLEVIQGCLAETYIKVNMNFRVHTDSKPLIPPFCRTVSQRCHVSQAHPSLEGYESELWSASRLYVVGMFCQAIFQISFFLPLLLPCSHWLGFIAKIIH